VDSATGLYCLEVDFLEFYERWLDTALACVRDGEFRAPEARYSYLEFGSNPRYQRV
jgi:hypothetical protein